MYVRVYVCVSDDLLVTKEYLSGCPTFDRVLHQNADIPVYRHINTSIYRDIAQASPKRVSKP